MAFLRISSPHLHRRLDTAQVMRLVLLATLPGLAALTWFFGWGSVVNVVYCSLLALLLEAGILALRGRPVGVYLRDGSALVTAVLLGIALPPGAPWWLLTVGIVFAIAIAKHLYGGLGYNPFNPAMIGYVVLLISFPVPMTTWVAPEGLPQADPLGILQALQAFSGSYHPALIDGVTAATPLDLFKQNNSLLVGDLYQTQAAFGHWGGHGWEWVNAGFLVGGLFLLSQRVFTWHAPIAMLAGLGLMASLFYDGGSSASGGSPLYHWFSGATMLGAFFILTDPVTSAVSVRGKLYYGFAAGVLIYLIRTWGNYPDAVAFSVLLMNFAAPLLDHYTQPRTYGHSRG